jgi:aryl-alcohol dehydrogenase-like predicted oxidoreductase
MGDADKGPVEGVHPARRRGLAAAPQDRRHRPLPAHDDDAATPLEETLGAFAELVRKARCARSARRTTRRRGLALAIETSERLGLPRYESLQPLYNLGRARRLRGELEPVCVEHGLGVINFYALASGFLTGKYRSAADLGKSVRGSGAGKYLNERGLAVLAALDAVAGTVGATPAQVALAWQIARPSITAPIASATTPAQLDELLAAARLTLDAPSIAMIDRVSRTASP